MSSKKGSAGLFLSRFMGGSEVPPVTGTQD